MRAELITMWSGRSPRERWLLAGAGVLVALMLAWLLIVRPLTDARVSALQRRAEAAKTYAETHALAAELERLRAEKQSFAPVMPLRAIGEAAAAAGFAPRTLEEEGRESGAVRLVIDAVRPQAFFGWVAEMEQRGLVVFRLIARPNADNTLAVEVTFRAPRA